MAKAKLDEQDLEILAELDLNSRASSTNIGKKLNLSSNVVNYSIKNLERCGVIKGYETYIDVPRLGYLRYRIYLKLQRIHSDIEKEMIDFLKNSPLCWWCGRVSGTFDLCALLWFISPNEASKLWDEFKLRYNQYLKRAIIVPFSAEMISTYPFTKDILKQEIFNKTNNCGGLLKTDEKDHEILKILSTNGRVSLSSISEKVGLRPCSVKYRIDSLISKKVILGFIPKIDMQKLGYDHYKVDFNLNSLKEQDKIQQYLLSSQNVYSLIKTIGWSDLEMRIYAKNSKELYRVLHEIRDEFSDEVVDFDLFQYREIVKNEYMPDF